METQDLPEPQPSTSNTGYVFTNEDYLSTLIRTNDRLRRKLEESRRNKRQSDCELVGAKRTISELRGQLEEAHADSDKNINIDPNLEMVGQSANAATNVSTEESAEPHQEEENNLSTLIQQLQDAHRNLQVCTATLQASADSSEACHQEHGDRVKVFKKSVNDLCVKLQEEQVTVMNKAMTVAPCNTEEQGNKSSSEEPEDLKHVNIQIHKLNLELLQRVHKDEEQQTEQLEQVTDDQKEKEALQSEIQRLKEVFKESKVAEQERHLLEIKEKAREELQNVALMSKIQQLKEILAAEETQNKRKAHDLEVDLLKKIDAVKQAETKAYLLQELLRNKKEAQAKMIQLENLKKFNTAVTTHRRKAEEKLHFHFQQWQEEKASLLAAIQRLSQLLHSKHPNLSEQERDMVKKVDDLQRRMTETLENKSQKSQSWMARHLPFQRGR